MDKIFVNKMEFYGYHGVFPEETKLGQRFIVDLSVELNLKKAGKSDSLDDSINYAELYQACQEVVEGKPFKLVEAVAETIAARILGQFQAVTHCTVKVIKPDPPIPGHYQSVAVEITRGR
ncbi:dihydroneopterin aldolase [Bacillus canaveralius]|uniref:7,8-dihydroneopterin aldolase n=1 Tax=Bacillus canaveralius TaxID=1403243 RepID=A0A2N5GHH7_9BACI|nr:MULTISPECIES: dihydroneopterin aldolase [Bacillus]PLR80230.1 dihydroneopterin aldolase [Bacillus canaveralius]PLR83203.1 dihydroneopterin aldolase [Bacillus sp. V33-4]PLS00455.1 dihydroneopterin aldolase [Bacillus canaveralius]RSK56888.1 dihydroneopterin aldolase [Bacillus canaveralius]